jgi:hypothetical protein
LWITPFYPITRPDLPITARKRAEEVLREREAWLASQREALQAALNGAALEKTLGVLVRSATDDLSQGTRAAFFLANEKGRTLHHVVGMSAEYAEAVDSFKIGPDALACGLATHTSQPVPQPCAVTTCVGMVSNSSPRYRAHPAASRVASQFADDATSEHLALSPATVM